MATKIGREKRVSKKPETPRLVKTKAQFDFLKKVKNHNIILGLWVAIYLP